MARFLAEADPDICRLIRKEAGRQNGQLELIAGENYTSEAILEATGSVFINKYEDIRESVTTAAANMLTR